MKVVRSENWVGFRRAWLRRRWVARRMLAWVAPGILLGGCVVGPNYRKPEATEIPASYAGATNGWKLAEPRADVPKGNWWEIFGDPELDRLESEGASANQQLKAAWAAFEQARAVADVAQSGYFPHLGLSPMLNRERNSANRPINGVSNGRSETYTTIQVPLDFRYEVDLWGRVRRTVEAARASEQADAADVEGTRLAIQAEIASDYFALGALDAELFLLRTNVEVFRRSLELTRNRRSGGIATDLDVAEAQTVLKTAEAQIPAVGLRRARTEHALAVLVGRSPSTFVLPGRPLSLSPPVVPSGLPSELIERRPDIASAERRMAAANANIGVAKAAFFPTVRLNGLAGFESVSAGTLFDWPSRLWAVGPSITVPLFEGGRPKATLRQARAAYDEVVSNYRQTVLKAFAEVEDNLSAQGLLASQQEAETAALEAARKTLEIASNRYRAGLVTYLEVATAQTAELERERATVRLRGEQLVTSVALVKSLGGGWTDLNPMPPVRMAPVVRK